jgi:hypothetical protein
MRYTCPVGKGELDRRNPKAWSSRLQSSMFMVAFSKTNSAQPSSQAIQSLHNDANQASCTPRALLYLYPSSRYFLTSSSDLIGNPHVLPSLTLNPGRSAFPAETSSRTVTFFSASLRGGRSGLMCTSTVPGLYTPPRALRAPWTNGSSSLPVK